MINVDFMKGLLTVSGGVLGALLLVGYGYQRGQEDAYAAVSDRLSKLIEKYCSES